MTINLARIIGAACATVTAAILLSAASPALAQSAPLSLSPTAQSKPKAVAPAVKVRPERKALKRSSVLNASTYGNSDLAFLSAGQYLDLLGHDEVIPVIAENEMSPLDFAAGTVRVVDPDELSEIDLANDPDVLLAQRPTAAAPVQQASAAPASDADEDDGVLNRILMTFAGALAMASAMRMIIA